MLLQILLCLFLPAILLYLEKQVKWIAWLGPVVLCYVLGIILGNLPFFHPDHELNTSIYEVSAVLAVPLVLFSAQLKAWLKTAGKTMLSFGICIFAALVSATLGFFLLGDQLPYPEVSASMTVGVYTGGTPNLTSIGVALGAPGEWIAKANLTDTLVSAPYLLLAFTVLQGFLLKFLPAFQDYQKMEGVSTQSSTDLATGKKVRNIGLSILLGIICLGLSFGLAQLFPIAEKGGIIVTLITLLGLGASLIRPIRQLKGTYETGEYLLLVFCIAVGMEMKLDILGENVLALWGFMAFVAYVAILIHYLFAYFLKIDADTTLITSVAGIMSPVFVGPIAKAINNKAIIPSGMTTAVVGYAVGNLVGIGLYYLLG